MKIISKNNLTNSAQVFLQKVSSRNFIGNDLMLFSTYLPNKIIIAITYLILLLKKIGSADCIQYFFDYYRKIIILIFTLAIFSGVLIGQSIFNLPYGELILELESKDKICVVKQISLLNNNDFYLKNCEILNSELNEILVLLGKSYKTKEITFAFISEKNEKLTPKFQFKDKSYSLISFIHNKKENNYKLELLDSDMNYHYLIKDIKSIKVKNKL